MAHTVQRPPFIQVAMNMIYIIYVYIYIYSTLLYPAICVDKSRGGLAKWCQFVACLLGVYTPGMMTDVVREVKEAARVREDAMLNR